MKSPIPKATGDDFVGRFREIVSDPTNLFIQRDSRAGLVQDNYVYLHNGLKVPFSGPFSYYESFSQILAINRGVHEPLEEFAFQQVLKQMPERPIMLELGAYWGHYSMWLKCVCPQAIVHLVEGDTENIKVGLANFEINKMTGKYIKGFVAEDQFEVDKYIRDEKLTKLNILHSDIQGFEVEMLHGSVESIKKKLIDYIFISTHSQELHNNVIDVLSHYGYKIEVAADYDNETTSFDGFVLSSSPDAKTVFNNFTPISRTKILDSRPEDIINYINNIFRQTCC